MTATAVGSILARMAMGMGAMAAGMVVIEVIKLTGDDAA